MIYWTFMHISNFIDLELRKTLPGYRSVPNRQFPIKKSLLPFKATAVPVRIPTLSPSWDCNFQINPIRGVALKSSLVINEITQHINDIYICGYLSNPNNLLYQLRIDAHE